MKKIKITEKQAELLGLNKIKESEDGLKGVGVAIGELIVRVVISGNELAKNKDRVLQLIARQDPDAKVTYFDATGKIVGNIKEIKRKAIERDLKALDPTITVEKKSPPKLKEGVKNLIKISKEQYNRIFADGLLKESEVKGGNDRVDKTFKKEFIGKDVQNLKPNAVKEDDFKIDRPNKSIPKMDHNVGHRDTTVMEGNDQIHSETLELIKYLYRKSEELSQFWKENGISYEEICDDLLKKKLIISKDGKYELPKSLGDAKSAVQALENELRNLIQTKASNNDGTQQASVAELETEDSNYPAGAEHDSDAPWNKKDDSTTPLTPKESKLEPVAFNGEIIILKDPQNNLFVFYYDAVNKKEFSEYASLTRHYIGKDEDGMPEYEYDEDFDITPDIVSNYVNDNLSHLTKGEGAEAYERGVELVKIDDTLRQELLSLYDKDKNIASVLEPNSSKDVDEVTDSNDASDAALGHLKAHIQKAYTPVEKTPIHQSKIVAKLHDLKAKEQERRKKENSGEVDEMTGAASSGAFTGPLGVNDENDIIKREMPETPVVGEVSTVASAGNFQYDTPGLANVGRNGEFKTPKKTKAEKTPQWAGGSFVKQPECSKMNNNKEAENGGCNQGASSLRTVKAKGSINAPSLGENKIYEEISKKTGKTVEEVKTIIESKNKKA